MLHKRCAELGRTLCRFVEMRNTHVLDKYASGIRSGCCLFMSCVWNQSAHFGNVLCFYVTTTYSLQMHLVKNITFSNRVTELAWLWTSVSSTSFQGNWSKGSDWERYWLEEELWPSKRKRSYRFSSLRNLQKPWCKVEPSSRSSSLWGEQFFSEWL